MSDIMRMLRVALRAGVNHVTSRMARSSASGRLLHRLGVPNAAMSRATARARRYGFCVMT